MKTNDENSRLFEKIEDILKAAAGKDVNEKFRNNSNVKHEKITEADMMNYIILRALSGKEIDQITMKYAEQLCLSRHEFMKIYIMGLQASRK